MDALSHRLAAQAGSTGEQVPRVPAPLGRERPGAELNLNQLRTFHMVARLRSFTRAAAALYLSQPAVSAHIRALERHFGARLFEVRHRRVFLTAEGEALEQYTERVFNLVGEAGQAIEAVRSLTRGRLHLGASTTIANYLLPPVLGQFSGQYPGLAITLEVGTTAAIARQVRAEEVPLGLVEAPVADPALSVEPFAQDELVLIVPSGHLWAAAGAVPASALTTARVLRREPGSGTQALVDAGLARLGVQPPTAMELGSTEALKQAVLAGLGVAWVSRTVVARELAAGDLRVVPVTGLDLRRELFCIRPRDARLSPAVRAFLSYVCDSGPAGGGSGGGPAGSDANA